jgi:heavy metal sensor kinase
LAATLPIGRALAPVLFAIVVLASGATLAGAWSFAGSAVRPVWEITEQARHVEAGTLTQRIVAPADTDEFRGLVAVLNRMLERLDQAFTSQRRLTANLSHELRSPLTALRGEIEVALRAERTPRDYQRVLHSALEEIERLSQMSDDLLLITRAEAGLLKLERQSTDLNDVVDRALATLRAPIEERGLKIERRLAAGGTVASLDCSLMSRAVHQLLDNAVKFTPVEGTVRVTTGPNVLGGVRFSVDGSGPGIAPDQLPHLFEPFYRADEARSRGTGTGLGLAMVAATVRLHGGSVEVTNQPCGGGARFDVVLPVG